MRRIAAALVLVLATACDSSGSGDDGGMCVEPDTVEVPPRDGWEGDSHCSYVAGCMTVLGCTGTECGVTCMENVFGADDCGCCGDDCEDTCSQILEVAIETNECFGNGGANDRPDECFDIGMQCEALNFDGRTDS